MPAAIATILYPKGEDFDLDYYLSKHMTLVAEKWNSQGLKSWKVIQFKNEDAIYQIQATLEFESLEALGAATQGEHAPQIFSDIKNFTKAKVVLVAGELVGSS